jgi:hypothetical protein
MHYLIRATLACSASLFVAACSKSDKAATDSAGVAADTATAMAAPAATAPAALNFADVAGKWNATIRPESGADTTATLSVLNATSDTTGWSFTFKNGLKVPVHVVAAGDSIVMTSDEYSSVRQKGVKVKTVTTMRMTDGKLAGPVIAHYKKTGPDSLVTLRLEAVKAP